MVSGRPGQRVEQRLPVGDHAAAGAETGEQALDGDDPGAREEGHGRGVLDQGLRREPAGGQLAGVELEHAVRVEGGAQLAIGLAQPEVVGVAPLVGRPEVEVQHQSRSSRQPR